MITNVTIKEDGTSDVSKIILGNKYENNDDTITFSFPADFENFNHYLIGIIKKNNITNTIILPIINKQFIISSSITYIPGNWSLYVMCREHALDLDQSPVDISAQTDERVFISDKILGIVNDNEIEETNIENVPLDHNLQIALDQFLELKHEVEQKLQNGDFNGKSAYEIAVENGFEGTEKEWLASLDYEHSDEFTQLANQVRMDAKQSAQNAQSASQSASESATSAEQASQSATSAQGSANSASQSATQASQSAESASQSATSAEQSKQSAEQSADQAFSSANIAKEQADKAQSIADSLDPIKFAVKESAEGNPVIISDGADWENQGLELYGQSEQATTTGAQLINTNEIIGDENVKNGVTFTKISDNIYQLNGIPDAQYVGNFACNIPLENGIKYIANVLGIYPFVNDYIVQSYNTESDADSNINVVKIWYLQESNYLTIPEDGLFYRLVLIRIQAKPGNSVDYDLTDEIGYFGVQEYNDTPIVFEPYTGGQPSPNLDYPQEIVRREINEIVLNSTNFINIFNKQTADKTIDLTISDDIITIYTNTEYTHIYRFVTFDLYIYNSGLYVISFDSMIGSENFPKGNRIELRYEGVTIASFIEIITKRTVELKEGQYTLFFFNGTENIGSYQIKGFRVNYLEQKPWEPYKEQIVQLTQPLTLAEYDVCDGKANIIGTNRIIFDGSDDENWRFNSEKQGYYQFTASLNPPAIGTINNSQNTDKMKSNFGISKQLSDTSINKEGAWIYNGNIVAFVIKSSRLEGTEETYLREWLSANNLIIEYQLSESNEQPLPEADQEAIRALKTFYPNTVIDTGCFTKVNYVADTKLYIEKKIAELNTDINTALSVINAQVL